MPLAALSHPRLLAGSALLALSLVAGNAQAQDQTPTWRPQVTERLVRLPATVLDGSIERDFQQSTLGAAVRQKEGDLQAKTGTLADLQAALELADATQIVAIRHQFLTEKEAYVRLAAERNALRQQELVARKDLLERLLTKLDRDEALTSASRRALIEQQQAARARLRQSIAKVDEVMLTSSVGPESRYAAEYEDKRGALDQLRLAIERHPMNQAPTIDGTTVTKADYLRHLIAASEGELALLTMEDEMLGYMAKLVSLDALSLAEQGEDPELIDSDVPEPTDVTTVVNFFTN